MGTGHGDGATAIGLAIERALSPLDALRALFLRAFGRAGRRWLVDREARVGLVGATSVAVALVLTLVAPLFLLALGPLVLGVPHLLADARYLLVRPKLNRSLPVMGALGVLLIATWIHPSLWVGSLAIIALALCARGSHRRRAIAVAAGAAVTACALLFEREATVVFAHGHNALAVVLFAFWTRRTLARQWPTLALTAGGVLLLILLPASAVASLSSRTALGADLAYFGSAVSWSSSPEAMARLALLFAFGQAVHYGVWLRLVPEQDRERSGIRSFTGSYRALVRDLGLPAVALFAIAALFLVAYGAHDVFAARNAYLRVALFHGPFELAVVALLFVENRPLRRAS